jgi:hypothetical protein
MTGGRRILLALFLCLACSAAFAGESCPMSLLLWARAAMFPRKEKAAAGLPHSKAFSRIILPGMGRCKGRTSVAKMS